MLVLVKHQLPFGSDDVGLLHSRGLVVAPAICGVTTVLRMRMCLLLLAVTTLRSRPGPCDYAVPRLRYAVAHACGIRVFLFSIFFGTSLHADLNW